MTFRLVLALAALICIVWGIAILLALGQAAGWALITIGLGVGVLSTARKRRN
ncbi:hypothetical protein [Rhodococcus sp. APC 3903]|uniref:hypothetical protein n=1 Tax=Rhodococcus sp. APC 3903 TaxID=3035193 RepID=UPI0025B53A6F|nr:hypothetical protein [Rhodococcus sp. APC 3903]MDN3461058.1 hypothetical protein [Rhodococcus sp. APC 3903]